MKPIGNPKSKSLAINILFAALFALFAWLQRNDVDPGIYSQPSFNNSTVDSALLLIFYLIIAIGFVVFSFRKLPTWFFVFAITVCFFAMITIAPCLWSNILSQTSYNIV